MGDLSGTQWVNSFSGLSTTDSYQASLYASYVQAAFYVDAQLGYAFNDNQMKRVIAIPGLQPRTATGRAGADQVLAQVEAGYKLGIYAPASASLTPFARFQGLSVAQAPFGESGANSLNLSVAQQTTRSTRSTLGAEFAAALDAGWRDKLAVQFRLGWAHEYADTSRPVTAALAGAPSQYFTVVGAQPQRDAAVIGLGASTAVGDGASLFFRYDGEVGAGTDSHALSAGFRLSW